MAKLEFICYQHKRIQVKGGSVVWTSLKRPNIKKLPQIVWGNNRPWTEANLWALYNSNSLGQDIKTVRSNMSHIYAYAKWLESESIAWWHFPERESERCLTRYRGVLINARNRGEIAPSTTSQRMATVIRFYRWMHDRSFISPERAMWEERIFKIKITTSFGLDHTMRVASTDLAIPNRKVSGALQLEDGVMPVSSAAMKEIINLADKYASEELTLMLRVGFFTGLRLGSITDLKMSSLGNATTTPNVGWKYLSVGPGARPPVATKFSVTGSVPIPEELLNNLLDYCMSNRRLKRQALASSENQDLIFLSRYGNSYNSDDNRAVNVGMLRLRSKGRKEGLKVMEGFNFHRTRATFATELIKVALRFMPVSDSIQFVKEACLHKDESTTMKYIKFIENNRVMADTADAFTNLFMGLSRDIKDD